ncbi:MAG: DinB family protein [Actinomycetota bacterium]|nr:DinB family protein [Actinomycetota bacterium]
MSEPAVPEPDVKDWTWTISRRCLDCGFDPEAVDHETIPRLTRAYAAAMAEALGGTHATTRPTPTTWSPLEYACHIRDVCSLFDRRLRLMRTEHDPVFENWDQDETALAQRYWEQRTADVAEQLIENADAIATAFGEIRDDEWQRPGRRSNGSSFTIDTFATYFLHDLAHHVRDVTA